MPKVVLGRTEIAMHPLVFGAAAGTREEGRAAFDGGRAFFAETASGA